MRTDLGLDDAVAEGHRAEKDDRRYVLGRGDVGLQEATDRICIFRGPIERMTVSPRRQAAIVRDTVVHEIAHHFGISDARLSELGLGDAR